MHLSILSRSSSCQYSVQYSFKTTGCFPHNHRLTRIDTLQKSIKLPSHITRLICIFFLAGIRLHYLKKGIKYAINLERVVYEDGGREVGLLIGSVSKMVILVLFLLDSCFHASAILVLNVFLIIKLFISKKDNWHVQTLTSVKRTRARIHQPFSRTFFIFFSKNCKLECNRTSDNHSNASKTRKIWIIRQRKLVNTDPGSHPIIYS